ncbi:MAG: Terminase-like family protein [Methanoregula sp. PtaU1.Bin051]|nr:MAG: Terminase-like family protein [Methanoregula sp. PtaU1.Bin051]
MAMKQEKVVKVVIGIDIGKKADHSAFCVVEVTHTGNYRVRKLQRLPLRLSYVNQADRIYNALAKIPRPSGVSDVEIYVDAGGVGRPMVDLLSEKIDNLVPVQLTAGDRPHKLDDGTVTVPKRDLVMALNLAFEKKRITIPAKIREREVLRRELEGFVIRLSAGGIETYEAIRAAIHDDLVIALAMCVYFGDKAGLPSADEEEFYRKIATGRSYESILSGERPVNKYGLPITRERLRVNPDGSVTDLSLLDWMKRED